MLRLALIGAVVALSWPAAADALTVKQVRAQADLLIESLMLDLIGFLESDDDAPSSYDVNGRVSNCRVTSRRRGRCAVEVIETQVGATCDAWGVVRQRGRRLTARLVDVRCGD